MHRKKKLFKATITAVLASPFFIYRVERDNPLTLFDGRATFERFRVGITVVLFPLEQYA